MTQETKKPTCFLFSDSDVSRLNKPIPESVPSASSVENADDGFLYPNIEDYIDSKYTEIESVSLESDSRCVYLESF